MTPWDYPPVTPGALPMADRLSPLDVSFLYLETPTTAMHVGSVGIFERSDDFDFGRLTELIAARIALAPRYRQKVRWVPGHLANPVWVDDPDFDIGYHVRRSALPRPGSLDQLRELVGRVQSRHLDRSRPLWEMYVIEGLAGDRFAVLTKLHHAMADGIRAVNLATVILDPTPRPREVPAVSWRPDREPAPAALVADAVADLVRRPTQLLDTLRGELSDVQAIAQTLRSTAGGLVSALRIAARPAPASPLNARLGEQRRFGSAVTELDAYKRVRKTHGGTVNDVILATVAGALHSWLLTRGEPVVSATTVRAMVPVSIRGADEDGLGNRVSSYFVDLPVGEADPVVRLHQVSYAMKAHKEAGQSVGAEALVSLSGFAPPTLHQAAARLAAGFTRRLFNLVVTNVPGPQIPLYAAGALMTEAYPVVPLGRDLALSVGVTSYNGRVCYGLLADRDALPDVDVFADCLTEALDELVETAR
jgi:diacylglycerol O-acyltransferase